MGWWWGGEVGSRSSSTRRCCLRGRAWGGVVSLGGVWSVGPGNAGPGAGLADGAPRSLLGSGAGAGLFNRDLRMRRLHIAARSGRGWLGRYDSALERGGPAHPNPSVAWASPRRRRTHRAKQAAHTGGFAGRQDAHHREESVPSACLCQEKGQPGPAPKPVSRARQPLPWAGVTEQSQEVSRETKGSAQKVCGHAT